MFSNNTLFAQQMEADHIGELTFSVISAIGMIPVAGAGIQITTVDQPDVVMEELITNESGETPPVRLETPPLELSLEPSDIRPYAQYNFLITASGYEPARVEGAEILPDVTAIQVVTLNPLEEPDIVNTDIIVSEHTLFYEYPPKIPEDEIKPMDESGEIVLSRVVIPEFVIVHDGVPSDTSAPNYYIRYKDYIKNVVSSEIYATWPEEAIYANVLCIQSLTLNRVFTEWYRNDGYNFTITSSTAYDQKWIYGRNIFENISRIVDTVFANYLSRPGVIQPIFTSYCDGNRVNCAGLEQWGSKYLAEQGYSAIEIIRYYFGNDMYINTTDSVAGVPSSWPGYNLSLGATGNKVQEIQAQLARIAQTYTAIPRITADGVFGPQTEEAVREFQQIFRLPPTGVIDYATWYEISDIYVGVTRIAEPPSR